MSLKAFLPEGVWVSPSYIVVVVGDRSFSLWGTDVQCEIGWQFRVFMGGSVVPVFLGSQRGEITIDLWVGRWCAVGDARELLLF